MEWDQHSYSSELDNANASGSRRQQNSNGYSRCEQESSWKCKMHAESDRHKQVRNRVQRPHSNRKYEHLGKSRWAAHRTEPQRDTFCGVMQTVSKVARAKARNQAGSCLIQSG